MRGKGGGGGGGGERETGGRREGESNRLTSCQPHTVIQGRTNTTSRRERCTDLYLNAQPTAKVCERGEKKRGEDGGRGGGGGAHSTAKVVVVVDRFYIALFSALEQSHCARM